ncbi:hypothetical protein HZD82_27970, partial [Pantoea agglomerans]|nr:hypothetical protein [Pantoea agglomerans]
ILPALLLLQTRARHLNLLQAGEEDAHYMGVDVKRTQHQLLTSLIGGPWFLWLILRQQRGLE